MSLINVGTTPNDGTGDTLRAAGIKINNAFAITAWDMTTNAFPTGGVNGQVYNGTGANTLVDASGNRLPNRVMATYIGDGSTYIVTDFILTPVLF